MTTPTPAEAARELGHWLDPQGRSSVTEVLDRWAPFRDAALLRRTLVEEGLIARTPDGREYWTTSGE